jgi:ribose/xylose/arabinose/galactoside ABC-type transport system permease subunit
VWLQSSTKGIAAIGQAFVILTGGIDLSVGGVALLASNVGAVMMTGQTAVPPYSLIITLFVVLAFGVFNGGLVSRLGMPALIVTLATWRISYGASYYINKGVTIGSIPESWNFLGAGTIAGVPMPVIMFIVVAVTAYFILHYTVFGRSLYAVGGNPVSSWLSGLDVSRILLSAYVICAFLAGLAGVIVMSRVMSAGMVTIVGLELDSITAAVIGGVSLQGGRGTLLGAVIGAFILGIINNGMNIFALNPAFQDMVKGGIVVTAVAIDYVRRAR